MNWSMLVLAIVLAVALYYLYIFLLGTTAGISSVNLKKVGLSPVAVIDPINNPKMGSYRYSYAIWVHVNNLSNIQQTNSIYATRNPDNIMYLQNPSPTTTTPSLAPGAGVATTQSPNANVFFSLDLYNDTSLYIYVNVNETNLAPYLVTPNFPLQKWTLLIVSFDNNIVDLYMDGKLIKSITLPSLPNPQNNGASMNFGTPDIDVYNYIRYTYPMDPQTAWSLYKSGQPPSGGMDNYNLNLKISQNNKPWGKWGNIPLF